MCHLSQQGVLWILRASPSPTPYSVIKLHLNISILTNGRAGGISYEMLESESVSVVPDSLWPHGLYSSWNSPGQNTGVGSLFSPPGDLPKPGSNPSLPHCRWILYLLNHQGSPRILEWIAYPFSSESFQPRNWTGVSCELQLDSLPAELPEKLGQHLFQKLSLIINSFIPFPSSGRKRKSRAQLERQRIQSLYRICDFWGRLQKLVSRRVPNEEFEHKVMSTLHF